MCIYVLHLVWKIAKLCGCIHGELEIRVKIKGLFKMAALNVKYGIDEVIGRCITAIVVNKPYFIERDQKRQKERRVL